MLVLLLISLYGNVLIQHLVHIVGDGLKLPVLGADIGGLIFSVVVICPGGNIGLSNSSSPSTVE